MDCSMIRHGEHNYGEALFFYTELWSGGKVSLLSYDLDDFDQLQVTSTTKLVTWTNEKLYQYNSETQ